MFGYMLVDTSALTEQEKSRYQQVYCGLCHTLGERLGQRTRLTLSHDMTFVALLLMSLYEPAEQLSTTGCPVHPLEKRTWTSNDCVDYAADMNVALMYHKCRDDWADDHDIAMRAAAHLLEGAYARVQQRWPRQCAALEQGLARISQLEQDPSSCPDSAGNVFGMVMGEVMVREPDLWQDNLRSLGQHLGRFVYQMDAACDLQEDLKKGSYNPFTHMDMTPEEMRSLLSGYMAAVVDQFERLPLVQDAQVLRSVLYAGVWHKFNAAQEKDGKTE